MSVCKLKADLRGKEAQSREAALLTILILEDLQQVENVRVAAAV